MIRYIKDRFNETSTYVILATGVISANPLSQPWSYIIFGLHVVAAFIADKDVTNDIIAKFKQS